MPKSKEVKQQIIEELTFQFANSNTVILTEFQGLDVEKLQDLRLALGDNATYTVVKNTLARVAARNSNFDFLSDSLKESSAIAFVKQDAVAAAKVLQKFATDNEQLVIKAGMMDGNYLSAAEVVELSKLQSRETILSQIAGALKAKQSQAARVLVALPTKQALLAKALEEKKS